MVCCCDALASLPGRRRPCSLSKRGVITADKALQELGIIALGVWHTVVHVHDCSDKQSQWERVHGVH